MEIKLLMILYRWGFCRRRFAVGHGFGLAAELSPGAVRFQKKKLV
jgi:hypothetical protein